jgi:hypothetical protein
MMKDKEEALRLSRDRNSAKAASSAWYIIGGLVAEALLVTLLSAKSWTLFLTVILPNAAIAYGVWRELHFGHKERLDTDALERSRDNRIAQSALLAASLFQSLEYEKARTAPRGFTDRQRADVVRRLSGWSKLPGGSPQAATIGRYFENLEAASLRDDLADILTEAGWQVVRFLEYRGLEVSAVEVVATEDARSQQVAMVLAGSLGAVCPLLEARVHPELTLGVGSAIIGEAFAKATAMTRGQWDTRVAVLVGSHPHT